MAKMTEKNLLRYKERLSLYNNYSFIQDIDKEVFFNDIILVPAFRNINNESIYIVEILIDKFEHLFVVKKLLWESNYFGFSCFSVEWILFKHADYKILRNALNVFIKSNLPPNSYFTINVPSEDITLVQALSSTKFNLVETRLNYFLTLNQNFEASHIDIIKEANITDIPYLRSVAMKMRNKFDRVHADPAFSEEQADEYLAKFAEESVKGFADLVLKVVDDNGIPFGFLAGNYPINISGLYVSKLVLAAVDSSVQRGRLIDLLAEMIYRVKLKKADYLTTITQAANIPAIRVWEKSGFSLFKVTHLYSIKND